ncbi:hypothetical protein MJL22_27940, partial [Salmonella enterica subsp. enterica serovar Montevideo]|nr:hypothetical protein [Salmonella enterica subsp. enterica serovar Montevideo]
MSIKQFNAHGTGLGLTTALVLYALRANIDLFYTPGEILYGKRETQQLPAAGQR